MASGEMVKVGQAIGTNMMAAGQEVPESYQSRQERARLACVEAGIVWPGTILPEGTALYESGVEKLKSDRAAWRRLPIAGEVVGLVAEALRAEDRKDFPEEVQNLRLRPHDGRMVRRQNLMNPNLTGLGYGPHTLRQLVAQIDPLDDAPRGFTGALLYLTDQERAEIINKRLDRMGDRGKDNTKVVLRTRLPHQSDGSRIARAALTTTYGSVTDHDIAGALGEMMREDRSGRLDYKPGDSRSRFEIIWPSEIPVSTFVVGDVHYGCLSITNSETGEGSLRIAPAVVRAACANLTLSTGEGTEVVIRHVGDAAMLLARLKRAIRAAIDEIEPLIQVITMSGRVVLGESWSPERAFKAVASRYSLPAGVVPTWLEQMKSSQYPESVWGIASSISEAAHNRGTWVEEAEWERVSSDVMAKVSKAALGGSSDPFAKGLMVQ